MYFFRSGNFFFIKSFTASWLGLRFSTHSQLPIILYIVRDTIEWQISGNDLDFHLHVYWKIDIHS